MDLHVYRNEEFEDFPSEVKALTMFHTVAQPSFRILQLYEQYINSEAEGTVF